MYRLKEIASSSMSGLPRVGTLSAIEKTTMPEIIHNSFFNEVFDTGARSLKMEFYL